MLDDLLGDYLRPGRCPRAGDILGHDGRDFSPERRIVALFAPKRYLARKTMHFFAADGY